LKIKIPKASKYETVAGKGGVKAKYLDDWISLLVVEDS